MELHKFGFKFFAADADKVDLLALIPVFHRWIQGNALGDILIDVGDYSHVPAGPGIILVAHEGNYGFDENGNRRGVQYYSKQPLQGDLPTRLATVARKTLQAAQLLSQDAELNGTVRVPGNELQFFANDRLVAPNTDEAYAALEPALTAFLDRLYAGVPYSVERERDPRERLGVTVRAQEPVALETLLERLAS